MASTTTPHVRVRSRRRTAAPCARSLAAVPLAVMLLAAATAQAQQAAGTPTTGSAGLQSVVVTGKAVPLPSDITGFGDADPRDVPLSATTIARDQIDAAGARRLADLTRFDASVTDAYNAPGYWDFIAVRGFTLDNRSNFRREGLPISAETTIALDNKERVEILKGTSGIQAGISAPGGLVNYVVKRPTEQPLRDVRLEATGRGGLLAAADLGGRFGEGQVFGYRLNLAEETLRPGVRSLDGQRSLVALAGDWRIDRDSILEAEIEWSRKRQPSQAGFSLLGSALPAPADPALNLNNQAWSQASAFEGLTGTLRYERKLDPQWRLIGQLGSQRLRSDDRMAFPFGCSAEGNYDRYCSDGSFDFYDFRSENETRKLDSAQITLKGRGDTRGASHDLSFSLTTSRVRNRFQDQAYNWVGNGSVDGRSVVPSDPTLAFPSTNRDERSVEFSAQDVIRWGERVSLWLGARHTRLSRQSVDTRGGNATDYSQGVTTPWLAASYQVSDSLNLYASHGQGVETQVVPNIASAYTNAGQALPALKSRQWEVGAKGGNPALAWQASLFRIERPMSNLDACARLFLPTCTGQNDGSAVHQGLELSAQWAQGPWRVGGGLTLLDASRRGSVVEPALNGKRPANVPETVLRAQAGWKLPAVPGLELQGSLSYEGTRSVLPDGSITLPAWTRIDAGLRYDTRLGGVSSTWTLGVDNLADRRYWKESPYQFGHVYLYPGAARAVRISYTAHL